MPVSRKRKKTRKSSRKPRPQSYVLRDARNNQDQDAADAIARFARYRQQLDQRRATLAAAAAGPMIQELVALAVARSDVELEDELCARIGRALAELDAPVEDHVDPDTFAKAVTDAAVTAVDTTLDGHADGWTHPWRVLTIVAGVLHDPLSEQALASIEDLRARPGGHLLPSTPAGPTVTGPVRWTRDAYGSRFGIVAPFAAADGTQRWYLWDIDACGHEAFTVHSCFHATPEEALADWQSGVGAPAADGTTFVPVDDVPLLHDLMPREQGMLRPGGENVEQFAEYHRSKRLAEVVIDATGPPSPNRTTVDPSALDPTNAATLFTAWLGEHRPDRARPTDLEELVPELARSWQIAGPAGLYHTCSPHRVAFTAASIRDYYQDDFAVELTALLPDWVAWLTDRNATPAHLAERCQPYARGEPHESLCAGDGRLDYLARLPE